MGLEMGNFWELEHVGGSNLPGGVVVGGCTIVGLPGFVPGVIVPVEVPELPLPTEPGLLKHMF